MKIKFVKYPNGRRKVMGCFDRDTNEILIQKDLPLKDKISTLLHELGHYIIQHLSKDVAWVDSADYTYDVICIFIDPYYYNKKANFKWLAKYTFKVK